MGKGDRSNRRRGREREGRRERMQGGVRKRRE